MLRLYTDDDKHTATNILAALKPKATRPLLILTARTLMFMLWLARFLGMISDCEKMVEWIL